MQNVLVTGGAGFIGSHLIEKLLSLDFNVVCLDNFDSFYHESIKIKNLELIKDNAGFTLVRGDIRDRKVLEEIFSLHNINAVIHLAGKAGVRPSIASPSEYYDVNVNGTLCILEVMNKYNVKKLVFASSSSVYGNNLKTPYSEEDIVDFPISPYAATKKSGELLNYTFHHLYHFDVINLRFFTVFGPRQRPDLAIHKFFKAIYSNQKIQIFGDGNTSRDYTYIDDIVIGIVESLKRILDHKQIFETINLGNNHPITLKNLISKIETVTNKVFDIENLPMQPGDVNQTYADIHKAKLLLNYHPKTTIESGLESFRNWYLNS